MTFKKDYINYLVYSVLNGNDVLRHNKRLKTLVGKIMSTDDIVKITYLVGKTAGLELLFKYLLYISDKIDKSQITIFNLKDNFDYDVQNLLKVFEKLAVYKSENVNKKIDSIEISDEKQASIVEAGNTKEEKSRIKIDATEDEEIKASDEIPEQEEEEFIEEDNSPTLTLIENTGTGLTEAEVFELSEINEDIENSVSENTDENADPGMNNEEDKDEVEFTGTDSDEIIEDTADEKENEAFELEEIEDEVSGNQKVVIDTSEEIREEHDETPETNIEIEVRKPIKEYEETDEVVKEESVTNEAYYKFESKFFEEVKILEKLFLTVEKDYKAAGGVKLSEKCLQSLTEIIEITSELSNLSRQLSFDLIADIFLTMNLYFTKAISSPEIITSERIRLLDSSLSLVNSLIKGEDYLNYDVIVDKIELLKSEMQRPVETVQDYKTEETFPVNAVNENEETLQTVTEVQDEITEERIVQKEPKSRQADLDSVNFKMRYLIKEFEKSFTSISNIKGEYKRFDALDKIDELNNALRLIAKIAAAVKMKDVLKLSEVAYVFLKYLKDYRMDLLDPEIQQIVKYIIFTFKMLLTDRKPEDFNVLVQYLNNPVKIFADS